MADYNQNEMYEKIKKSTQVSFPDSLKTENIEKMLQERKPKRKRYGWISAGVAAAMVAIGMAVILSGFYQGRNSVPKKSAGNENPLETQVVAEAGEDKTTINSKHEGKTVNGLRKAESYEEVREYFHNYEDYGYNGENIATMELSEAEFEVAAAGASNADKDSVEGELMGGLGDAGESGEADHSTTNIQEEGVEEADIMLTDGNYIYVLRQGSNYRGIDQEFPHGINIIRPDRSSGKLTLVSNISLDGYDGVYEMYLHKEKLIIIVRGGYYNGVCAVTYDISNREQPQKMGQIEVEGEYSSSRLVDGYLYLFANDYDIYLSDGTFGARESFIPCVQEERLEPNDIYIPDIKASDGYLIGASMSVEQPNEVVDQFAILMCSSQFYVSQNNIYVTEVKNWKDTVIHKFSYQEGKMEPVATGSVPGSLNNSFSMDEYQGYLRMVTTSNEEDTSNQLYVLDENLQTVGKIENLAKGERIYSARFLGNTGFFVTYRQMDPLFSVDLSNPSNPVILGELKISGFSEYLHPYGVNRLLGVGWETTFDEKTGNTQTEGMKLSMFDTSNMGNVHEIQREIVEDVSDMLAGSDHHSVLININKNLFGFAVTTTLGRRNEYYYRTYRYEEGKGFELVTNTKLEYEFAYLGWIRGVYIEDILYIFDNTKVTAVSLSNGAVLDELILGN